MERGIIKKLLHSEVYPKSKIEHLCWDLGCNGRKCSSHFSYFSHVSFKRTCSYCTIYPTVTSQVLCPPVSGILTIYRSPLASLLTSSTRKLCVHFGGAFRKVSSIANVLSFLFSPFEDKEALLSTSAIWFT